jgi:hypothetical protein
MNCYSNPTALLESSESVARSVLTWSNNSNPYVSRSYFLSSINCPHCSATSPHRVGIRAKPAFRRVTLPPNLNRGGAGCDNCAIAARVRRSAAHSGHSQRRC